MYIPVRPLEIGPDSCPSNRSNKNGMKKPRKTVSYIEYE